MALRAGEIDSFLADAKTGGSGVPRAPMVDLAALHAPLAADLARAFERTLRSSMFILGPEVEQFEAAVAGYLGVNHAIGVSSGSDALLVALAAHGIGPGDEVITTPFTFFATVEAILRLGARPRFVDVDPSTLLIDVTRVREAIGERTRAVLPVHLYGSPANLAELRRLGEDRGIAIVEDAAQSFGACYAGRAAGTWGACGCFSFFPTKVLGALGDGGVVVTDDSELAARCRRIRQHGSGRKDEHSEVGGNFRLDALQAAVLSVKLPWVDQWIGIRRAHGREYDATFRELQGLAPVEWGDGCNGAVYTVRVHAGRRDALRRHLAAMGIETAIYYARPAHLQPVLAADAFRDGSLRESERAATEVLSLPIHAALRSEQRAAVIEGVRSFFR